MGKISGRVAMCDGTCSFACEASSTNRRILSGVPNMATASLSIFAVCTGQVAPHEPICVLGFFYSALHILDSFLAHQTRFEVTLVPPTLWPLLLLTRHGFAVLSDVSLSPIGAHPMGACPRCSLRKIPPSLVWGSFNVALTPLLTCER